MRVLIVRTGAMGDVLHALPGVAGLRHALAQHGQPFALDWVVDPRWQALLVGDSGEQDDSIGHGGPVVDRVHLAETRLWSRRPFSLATLRSILALRRQLRARRYDLVVDMQGTLRSAVIGRMAGGRDLVGYSDPRESAAARLYRRRLPRSGAHVVEQGAALLAAATGLAIAPAAFALPRIDWAEHWADAEAVPRRPLAVLSPGGGWAAKLWPVDRFAALASQLQQRGFDVAVNAPSRDDALSCAVVQRSGGAARQVVCNVAGLVALLRRADLFVGGDTGPMHLAAALAVPVVALFGPTSPARNGPWGPGRVAVLRDPASPTTYKRSAAADPGLASLRVEAVLAALDSLA